MDERPAASGTLFWPPTRFPKQGTYSVIYTFVSYTSLSNHYDDIEALLRHQVIITTSTCFCNITRLLLQRQIKNNMTTSESSTRSKLSTQEKKKVDINRNYETRKKDHVKKHNTRIAHSLRKPV